MDPLTEKIAVMDEVTVEIIPTEEQLQLLRGDMNLAALKASDFLGYQDYINNWIMNWTQTNDYAPMELPLCVSETIITDKKMRKHYHRYVKAAVVSHDIEWLRSHYIVSYERVWNYVQFEHIPKVIFEILWSMLQLPLSQASFLAGSRRMDLWPIFVAEYGPTACLEIALNQKWSAGTIFCLNDGADLSAKDFMRDAMLMEPVIARAIIATNPPATKEAFLEFLLWKRMHRIQDVPLIEEFFWINGFKENE